MQYCGLTFFLAGVFLGVDKVVSFVWMEDRHDLGYKYYCKVVRACDDPWGPVEWRHVYEYSSEAYVFDQDLRDLHCRFMLSAKPELRALAACRIGDDAKIHWDVSYVMGVRHVYEEVTGDGELEILVKWKGFPMDNRYYPLEAFDGCPMVQDYVRNDLRGLRMQDPRRGFETRLETTLDLFGADHPGVGQVREGAPRRRVEGRRENPEVMALPMRDEGEGEGEQKRVDGIKIEPGVEGERSDDDDDEEGSMMVGVDSDDEGLLPLSLSTVVLNYPMVEDRGRMCIDLTHA